MKLIFSFALILFVLQSCTTYYFTSPQPAGGEKLSEIPENLRGTWNCTYDSVGEKKCVENGGYAATSNQISIKEKNETTTWTLGREVELLKMEDFYVLNFVDTRQAYDSKGKKVETPLYSAMLITESYGSILLWNVDEPWDKKSEKKIAKAMDLHFSLPVENDTLNQGQNVLLNFSLKKSDLESISKIRPNMMFLSDSIIFSGDEIDWGVDDGFDYLGFEKKSDERKYIRLDKKMFRLFEKEEKIERKKSVIYYKDQFTKSFGDAEKGYVLMKTEEVFADSSQVKPQFDFSENPTIFDVYRLVVYYRDVIPSSMEYSFIDGTQIIPVDVAEELIQLNKISYVTFKVNGKPCEEGLTTWNHLSDEDKEMLIQFMVNYE